MNVPVYATNSALETRYIIDNSDSVMCFVGGKDHRDKVLEVKDLLPGLREIVIFDDLKEAPGKAIDLKTAMAEGSKAGRKEEFEKRISGIRPADLAIIIYTSGTTGDPKGVMLSHNNFISNVNQIYSVDPELFKEERTLLSFLPLSHSFERAVGYYSALNAGKTVVFAQDFSKILQNLQEVKPTLIVSVPRLYEKIHAGILAKISDAPPLRKAIFT